MSVLNMTMEGFKQCCQGCDLGTQELMNEFCKDVNNELLKLTAWKK